MSEQQVASESLGLPAGLPRETPPEIMRRRFLAASEAMPPLLAEKFTVGALAVLTIIAREVKAKGRCELHVDEIAARASASPGTALRAVREAERLGLIEVTRHRRQGAERLPCLIAVVDRRWLAWLKRGSGR